MKRRLLTLLLATIMVLGLTACGTKDDGKDNSLENIKDDEKDNSLEYIKDNKKLIVGLDDSFPPMGFRDDADNIVGFDIDLANAVAEKLGVDVVFQPIAWEAKEMELSTKSIDCIWNGFSITEDRLEQLTMSDPYMGNSISLVVVKDSTIATMADMKDKKLALQSGSSAEETLDADENKDFKASLAEVNGFDNYETALMDLETENSDAVLMDSVVANYMINDLGKDFKVLEDSLVAEEYAVGFRKGEEALCSAVEKAMKDLKKDGTVEEISTKWFGSDTTTIK